MALLLTLTTSYPMNAQLTEDLLNNLKARFLKHMHRHKEIKWTDVASKLMANYQVLSALQWMEESGGEPDVVAWEGMNNELVFVDCSAESPAGRRNLCYDNEALEARKTFKPTNSACGIASEKGVQLLNEQQYFYLQTLGEFDLKTSSWLSTPDEIRSKGGALFGDRRFGRVFIYHNGAQSYYGVRGFRALLKL